MRLLSILSLAFLLSTSALADRNWTQIYDGTKETGPQAREHHSFWLDKAGNINVYSGLAYRPRQWLPLFDHWTLKEGKWTENSQAIYETGYYHFPANEAVFVPSHKPASGTTASAPIPEQDALLIYRSPGSVPVGETGYEYQIDLHPFVKLSVKDGTTEFLPIGDVSEIPLAQLGNLIYDPIQDHYLFFCGLSVNGDDTCDNVQRFKFSNAEKTQGSWTKLTNTSDLAAPSRYGAAAIFDEVSQRIVVVGGGSRSCNDNPICPREDNWTLKVEGDTYTWTKLDIPTPPAGRNACWAYDSIKNRMLMLGQTPNARDNVEGLHILDLSPGAEKWETQALPDEVKIRSSCRGTFDKSNNRFLFGFGNSIKGVYTDIWSLQLDQMSDALQP